MDEVESLVEQLRAMRGLALLAYRGINPDAASPAPHLVVALGKIVAIVDEALGAHDNGGRLAPGWRVTR
jgi:hypothetical protein